jgi:cation/acetate symporter
MATGADWMSAASFIGMAGTIYGLGYDGLAYIMGWTGGYVLLAVFLGPYLRKFGQYTIPDFLGARYGGHETRLIGVAAAIAASFTYLVAQITGAGIIMGRFLGTEFTTGVVIGLLGILVCSLLGGMKAVTWTQVAQYLILIIAYLAPVTVMSYKHTGVPVSEIMYGQVLQKIDAREKELFASPAEQAVRDAYRAEGGALAEKAQMPKPYLQPFARLDRRNVLALTFCLMVGTAGLPHILMRYYTVPSVKDARSSVGWSLFFIFLLYFTAPAYAAFARWEVLSSVVGTKIAELPAWMTHWAKVGLVSWRDVNLDGILQFGELTIGPDAIVLATPEIAGLPYVISGLVAAGGLAAALSTADGLLLTISNALSHDLYYKMIDPGASILRRLTISRVLLVVSAAVAAWVATFRLTIIVELVAWAFSIAAAAFFPALVMGVWDKRANKAGAVAGMLAGFGATLFYLVGSRFFGLEWFGIKTVASGVFGIPLGFLTIFAVSRLTAPPSQELQEFVESVRYPRGSAGAGARVE